MVFPESKRLHSIIERVVSADETTSTPSKIIASSINNLAVWYGKRDPISHRLHLFGPPSRCRTAHIIHQYDNENAPRRPYYFCWTAIPFAYDMKDQSAFSVRTESILPLDFEQHARNPLHATALTLPSGDFRPAPNLHGFPGVVPQKQTFATGIQVVMFSGQLTCLTCFVAPLTA